MKEQEFICIMCPVGCNLKVQKFNNNITVSGNACPRGEIFGKSEATNPTRMVTSVVPYRGGTVSVKTTNPVSKKLIKQVLFAIKQINLSNKPKLGEVLIKNVCETGEDIVVTGVNL